MTWKTHFNPRGRWATGAAFFHSRAGARWIAALAATSIVFFFVVWRYHDDAYAGLLQAGSTTTDGASGGGGGAQADPASATRLPAWIDTPPAFDVSRVPGGYVAPPPDPTAPVLTGLPPGLAEAARRFLARPALSHEQARAQNEAGCPPDQLERQVNADQLRDGREGWLAVGASRVAEMRGDAVRFLAARAGEEGAGALVGPGLAAGSGREVARGSRGVVIAAGNKRTVERAAVCVREMQRLGWKGPVEVWHFEGELEDEKDRETLKALGVGIHMVSC